MRRFALVLLATLTGFIPAITQPASAQRPDTFLDPGAAALLARARSFRDEADSTILSYTGTVRTRMAAGIRMPLKDRTLYRRETTSRIRWSRDAAPIIKSIAFREQTPAGLTVPGMGNVASLDEVFDPTEDRIYFGLTDRSDGDNEIWIEHPLVAGAEAHYRYKSGDTITITMQGHSIRVIELRVIPRESSGHLVTGSLWIDPSNGTVVQALYRLARPLDIEDEVVDPKDRDDMKHVPGMFKPMQFDITLVAIEYSLYDLRYWMPRVTRLEGYLRAGVIRTPASYEISYDIDDVVTATPAAVSNEKAAVDSVTDAWRDGGNYYSGARKSNGRVVRMLVPMDSLSLMKSPELPPPIWKESTQFVSGKEMDEIYDRLSKVAPVTPVAVHPTLVWGSGAADLLRYNRVEALSVGARAEYRLPQIGFSATGRIGLADLHPNLVVAVDHASLRRTMTAQAYHTLTPMDIETDPFGVGNSMSALLLGRDDGEYYRATGVSLTFSPSEDARAHSELTFFAQHDDSVARETNISLRRAWQSSFRFRPNVAAAKTDLEGVSLGLRPWWGTDPFRIQGGLDILAEGATGGYQFARARVTARTAIPIGARHRVGIEAGAGTSTGDVPPQRLWYIGGANTLRGYDGSAASGTSFGRARIDVARTFGWGGLMLFSDAGWAGDRTAFDSHDILYSAGVGSSLLDGLMRVDLARALSVHKQWRLELYVDALL